MHRIMPEPAKGFMIVGEQAKLDLLFSACSQLLKTFKGTKESISFFIFLLNHLRACKSFHD
jgi:hypothetical protein